MMVSLTSRMFPKLLMTKSGLIIVNIIVPAFPFPAFGNHKISRRPVTIIDSSVIWQTDAQSLRGFLCFTWDGRKVQAGSGAIWLYGAFRLDSGHWGSNTEPRPLTPILPMMRSFSQPEPSLEVRFNEQYHHLFPKTPFTELKLDV